MKRIIFFLAFLFTASIALPQPPPGYYDPAFGLYGTALQGALHNIIKNHTVLNYDNLYTYFAVTDIKPNNTVWDMYSDIPGSTPPYTYQYVSADQCGSYTQEGDCFNREHSWPKSWFGDIAPMNSDLFHLYPTDGWVNNKRGNLPYGEVTNPEWTSQNGSRVGNCSWPGYSGQVFEPIDEYKGDFARSYFYMSTRYYTEDASWPGSNMTTGAQLKPWARSMMLQWSTQDPVSQKEIDRNNGVYLYQHNRNPFIDNPQWAFDIWGPGAGITENTDLSATLQVYPNPSTDYCQLLLPVADKNLHVSLVSTTGTSIIPQFETTNFVLKLDVKGLASGSYILMLNSPETHRTYHALLIHR